MTISTPAPIITLSTLVREGSKVEHEAAEGSTFMSELLAGRLDAEGYAHYLAVLRPVYAALEEVGRELASNPLVAVVLDPELERLAALDADLDFWTKGEGCAVTSRAADAYVARIEATRRDPKLYIAHHYTRYLGDLSGGQAIGRILTRTYELERPEGVRFYEFTEIPKPKPYKDAYRARLDALPLTEEDKDAVLAEVKDVFGLNGALFTELSTNIVKQ
ncbi:heme oxygenase (biliverdin-producing) [Janibacter cremeus]|uniref:Heme oxygenase n=1 Tax=Janibacter cremeus TaxID=1285192 RepID=A0A852VMY0_9MICO|nr:biliverdin-producing heme oxygenase [Janibacter cremeus]NYF97289.1 heme oxygenase [Janibacter cremeus]